MSPSDSRGSGSNPHTSSHGHSGAELTKRPLSEPTSKQTNGNCNARANTSKSESEGFSWTPKADSIFATESGGWDGKTLQHGFT